MKKSLKISLFLCACFCLFSISANGQGRSPSETILRGAGKTTVIVVGTAAKVTWATTKFAVKYTAKPAAKMVLKPLVMSVAPKVTIFGLKLAGKVAKKAIPAAGRLSLMYLRTRLPI